jgi:hypothetical protein
MGGDHGFFVIPSIHDSPYRMSVYQMDKVEILVHKVAFEQVLVQVCFKIIDQLVEIAIVMIAADCLTS